MEIDIAVLNTYGVLGFWRWDFRSGRVRTCPGLNRFLGLASSETWLERTTADHMHHVHPADRDWVAEQQPLCVDAAGLGLIGFRMIDRDGDTHAVMSRGTYEFDSAGRLQSGRGVLIDVTTADRDAPFPAIASARPTDPLIRFVDSLIAAHEAARQMTDPEAVTQIEALLVGAARRLAARLTKTPERLQ